MTPPDWKRIKGLGVRSGRHNGSLPSGQHGCCRILAAAVALLPEAAGGLLLSEW